MGVWVNVCMNGQITKAENNEEERKLTCLGEALPPHRPQTAPRCSDLPHMLRKNVSIMQNQLSLKLAIGTRVHVCD